MKDQAARRRKCVRCKTLQPLALCLSCREYDSRRRTVMFVPVRGVVFRV